MEFRLKVGDLLDEEADAILVSANTQLNLSGGVGGAILARGNEPVQRELHAWLATHGKHYVEPGSLVETSAGNLRARVLLHCVTVDGFYGSSVDLVTRTVQRALDRAIDLGCGTVAMPALATGYGPLTMSEFAQGLAAAIGIRGLPLERLTVVVRKEDDLADLQRLLDRPRTRKLYRPVGLAEMALIVESDGRAFPPRRPEQPIFYPVLNAEYAEQIAREWNTRDEASSYAGYVTEFEVDEVYVSRFEEHVVGASMHRELWVPAEELPEFNRHIVGRIQMRAAFFGEEFVGFVLESKGAGKRWNARQQFQRLLEIKRHHAFDLLELTAHPARTYLHFPLWVRHDYEAEGISAQEKRSFLQFIAERWRASFPRVRLLDAEDL